MSYTGILDTPLDRGDAAAASSATQALPARNASSKYDFEGQGLAGGERRPLLRPLQIPNHVAIKIAHELKNLLVDNSLLDVYGPPLNHLIFIRMHHLILLVDISYPRSSLISLPTIYSVFNSWISSPCSSQSDLEANLFKVRLHHQRVPLVILVCGTACTGKSTIATQLAQRLNLPNVLQTDMVYELLRTSTDSCVGCDFNSPEELITEFCRECRVVRKGLAGDLKKAMKDGKPIMIERIHLDPSIYLKDEEKRDGDGDKDLDQPKNNTAKIDKPAAEPIVVPIVLRMSDFDYKALLEEWIATRAFRDNCLPQDYLCSFESQGLTIVDISANSFPQTWDWLHSYLLQCIERGLLAACSESCNDGGN
ncbi:hypothetical protein HU200_035314 [Digitaria exilis]|uniref:Uncharacterized protein n=1 Tax=Digitaria exilis TaxID=1010633 RepID=A0A835EIS5_9POAL|nr:hypothetical protein HU200_035314 [Digitaria exilis]